MARVETSVVINKPPEEVFAYVADFSNFPNWQKGLDQIILTSEGPTGVGSTWRETRKVMGRRMETTAEITEWEENSRTAMRSTSGPMDFRMTLNYSAVDGGTRVSVVAEAKMGPFSLLFQPIFSRMLKGQLVGDFRNLKEVLESES